MLTVQSLSALDPVLVQQTLQQLTEQIQALNPNVDAKRGAFHDLLLYLSSVLAAAQQTNITYLRQSNSLLAVTENPSLADTDVLDAIASNFLVTRQAGTIASGPVVLVLNALQTTTIGSGTLFTISGLTYKTQQLFIGRTDNSLVTSSNDRLITANGDGTYSMSITVFATSNGSIYNVQRGTQVTGGSGIPNILRMYVSADFTGGTDDETNQQLLNRLQAGISSKDVSNRAAIDGLIRSVPAYTQIPGLSTIGFGDAEMIRYHSVFPVAFGGRVDSYVRTAAVYENLLLKPTATLISKVGSVGTWQFNIARSDAPGFYEVSAITQLANNGLGTSYTITSDVRGFDVSVASPSVATPSTTFIPDITSALEAAYSRYSTTVIQFTDTDTDATSLSISTTKQYAVGVSVMPSIADIQDLISARSTRPTTNDLLVKAPVPCFVTITVAINVLRNSVNPDGSTVSNTVSISVNRIGFTGTLSAATIASDLQGTLPSGSTVTSVTLSGRLRKPNNSSISLGPSTVALNVSDDTANMTTGRTVAFICRPADVTVNLTTVDPPEV